MNKLDLLRLANKNLWRRKGRTILTMIGVFIGTSSIVIMLSLGIGIKENQRRDLERWGSLNIIRVYSGVRFDDQGNPLGEANQLDDNAVNEIKQMEGVVGVSPAYEFGGEASWGRKRGYIQLIGVDPSQLENLEVSISEGRLFTPTDRYCIVVGSQVMNNFMDERAMRRGIYTPPANADPKEMLNQRIAVTVQNNWGEKGQKKVFNFQVVGIMDEKNMERSMEAYASIEDIKKMRDFMLKVSNNYSQQGIMAGGRNSNSQARKSSQKQEENYSFIIVRTKDVAYTKKVSQALRDAGYNAYSIADALEGIEQSSKIIQAILGGIGGITLLVAAIGITNTMVMSIYERTREIGIMKVIGASFADIRTMFLAEAGLIGFMGGGAGLLFSYLASYFINKLAVNYINMGMPMEEGAVKISIISPWLALFAIGFSILIGLISGLYPANRAIKLSPIKAIRNE
jgi:ABC-type antimicrobial peptide transport system permease subunit